MERQISVTINTDCEMCSVDCFYLVDTGRASNKPVVYCDLFGEELCKGTIKKNGGAIKRCPDCLKAGGVDNNEYIAKHGACTRCGTPFSGGTFVNASYDGTFCQQCYYEIKRKAMVR